MCLPVLLFYFAFVFCFCFLEIPALLADVRKVLPKDTAQEVGMLKSPNEAQAVPFKPADVCIKLYFIKYFYIHLHTVVYGNVSFFKTFYKVKLGSDEITISSHCWETAKSQKTANAMARVLLMGLFSVDILIKSNLTGGMNKVDPAAERRQALDGKRLQVLVGKYHPSD